MFPKSLGRNWGLPGRRCGDGLAQKEIPSFGFGIRLCAGLPPNAPVSLALQGDEHSYFENRIRRGLLLRQGITQNPNLWPVAGTGGIQAGAPRRGSSQPAGNTDTALSGSIKPTPVTTGTSRRYLERPALARI